MSSRPTSSGTRPSRPTSSASMKDGSPKVGAHDEVHGDKGAAVAGTLLGSRVIPGDGPTTPENTSIAGLDEAMKRDITELDLAAYGKDDFTEQMEKNLMQRMFATFDMQQQGYLDKKGFTDLMNYLHKDMADEKVVEEMKVVETEGDKLTFDKFWTWWKVESSEKQSRSKAKELVQSDFAVPYHQQQLFTEEEGEKFTPNYRCNFFFRDLETGAERQISPWHDIPLRIRDQVRTAPESSKSTRYNFICEIPKWTRAKFEIATTEKFNPIKQDMKNGIPRFYKHGDMMWNYGAFPQTWESTEVDFLPGIMGDNDPLDAIEIGMVQLKSGSVHATRILGILGMIDDGEMDWKVICICVDDPLSKFLRDIDDVPKYLPGCLDAIREWLRSYKICQGGVENKFAFDGEFKDKAYAMNIIDEANLMWSNLKKIQQKSTV